MQHAEQPSGALARRLRDLRLRHWPDLRVTQQQVAEALGGERTLSESLISSWESIRSPALPPPARLRAIATFFASRRSLADGRARLLKDHELTAEELTRRNELYEELVQLRYAGSPAPVDDGRLPTKTAPPWSGSWHFKDQAAVTIVCARLPMALRERMPYADPADPDYVRAYSYADLDALIELHGHIRAANPAVQVNIRLADSVEEDAYTDHLVLLGGQDWNLVTRDSLRLLSLPIRHRWSDQDERAYDGVFEVGVGDSRTEHRAVVHTVGEQRILREDVGLFFRGINPYNVQRTLTLCNGMFGRGTYGSVRALTDPRFRDRNEEYVAARFAGKPSFSILFRVFVSASGEALTPDWTIAEHRLFEWTLSE